MGEREGLNPELSTWLSGRSTETAAAKISERGSCAQLPAAPSASVGRGRCLWFCTVDLFWCFPSFPVLGLRPGCSRHTAARPRAAKMASLWRDASPDKNCCLLGAGPLLPLRVLSQQCVGEGVISKRAGTQALLRGGALSGLQSKRGLLPPFPQSEAKGKRQHRAGMRLGLSAPQLGDLCTQAALRVTYRAAAGTLACLSPCVGPAG